MSVAPVLSRVRPGVLVCAGNPSTPAPAVAAIALNVELLGHDVAALTPPS